MSIERRIGRLERQSETALVVPVEMVETFDLSPEEGDRRVLAALGRAEAIAGPYRPGQPPRVIIVNCVAAGEDDEDEREGR